MFLLQVIWKLTRKQFTMKTAITIPDPLAQNAKLVASQLGITHDELYVRAIEAFLRQHLDDAITAKLNEVYAEVDSELDPVMQTIQWLSLPKEEW